MGKGAPASCSEMGDYWGRAFSVVVPQFGSPHPTCICLALSIEQGRMK